MEIAIVLFIIAIVGVMFWSVKVSRRFSIIVFGVILLGIAVAIIIWQGFSQQALKDIGFIGLGLFVAWLRISKSYADTVRARAWSDWMDSKSKAVCKMCDARSSYQQVQKNLNQLFCHKYTCPNCGAESKVIIDDVTKDNAG